MTIRLLYVYCLRDQINEVDGGVRERGAVHFPKAEWGGLEVGGFRCNIFRFTNQTLNACCIGSSKTQSNPLPLFSYSNSRFYAPPLLYTTSMEQKRDQQQRMRGWIVTVLHVP